MYRLRSMRVVQLVSLFVLSVSIFIMPYTSEIGYKLSRRLPLMINGIVFWLSIIVLIFAAVMIKRLNKNKTSATDFKLKKKSAMILFVCNLILGIAIVAAGIVNFCVFKVIYVTSAFLSGLVLYFGLNLIFRKFLWEGLR